MTVYVFDNLAVRFGFEDIIRKRIAVVKAGIKTAVGNAALFLQNHFYAQLYAVGICRFILKRGQLYLIAVVVYAVSG